MYMYVHIESPIMCPYKRYPTRGEKRGKKETKKKKKKSIYVLYEYLVFTSIIQCIIITYGES